MLLGGVSPLVRILGGMMPNSDILSGLTSMLGRRTRPTIHRYDSTKVRTGKRYFVNTDPDCREARRRRRQMYGQEVMR